MRRLRRTPALRALRRESRLSTDDFVCPLFVVENEADAGPVASMPGVSRFTVEGIDREIEAIVSAGLKSVLIFGVPGRKDATGSGAAQGDSAVARAIHRIRRQTDRLAIITDVCLCSYTDHGHCGVIAPQNRDHSKPRTSVRADSPSSMNDPNSSRDHLPLTSRSDVEGEGAINTSPLAKGGHRGFVSEHGAHAIIDNDATLNILGETAVAHARAGADVVAPSGMMDGAVGALRSALDATGFNDVAILSYAVKYASSFYGPFRDAADSTPAFGDRRSYQMDPANAIEALEEARLDVQEGADALMVKPALPYLDVIRRVKDAFPAVPLAAYQVSGEYSMIQAAAQRGWLDEKAVALESLTAIKRAGADIIITYFAKSAAGWLQGQF